MYAISLCSFPAVVGLLYPCLDSHLGEPHKFKREWASVMRCIAVFVGINHASAVSFFTVLCGPSSFKQEVAFLCLNSDTHYICVL